jgi:cytochrome c oxidase assembly factor 5
MVQRHPARDCLREPLAETLPLKCRQLAKGLGECRRGMLDMRKRFRGNQAISMKQLEKADIVDADGRARPGGYQLYGGRTAFGGAMGETSGNEKDKVDWREAENEAYRKTQGGGKS